MTANGTNPKVDTYLRDAKTWRAEFETLRKIALDCELTEDFKWGHPCYTCEGSNIVLIHGFKDYCALLFFKGALLKDDAGLLVQQTENVQAGRQIRFTRLQDILNQENALKAYIHQAIEVEKAGLKIDFKRTRDFAMPEEFRARLDEDSGLRAAFDALTPGRQKAYLLYFSAAKQAKTREARVEKYRQAILDGKGLDD